jgi:C-terminal processing protease CtpA/Prc
MAPCIVKALVEGSASYACGGISPGDILLSVDGVQVWQMFA